MCTTLVVDVHPEIHVLFTQDPVEECSHVWKWDRDTSCFRDGNLSTVAALRPGDTVNLFAEISGEHIVLTRVEAVSLGGPPTALGPRSYLTELPS